MVMIDVKIDEAYSPGGEATRMTMVMIVDEIAEAYDLRNCDGRHDHDKKNTTEKERTTAEGAEGIGALGSVLPRSLHYLSLSARCKQTVFKDCEIT